MTDQEINEAVARKLGYRKEALTHSSPSVHADYWWRNLDNEGVSLPDFCHSIAAAWEIVPHIPGFWLQRMTTHWNVCNYQENDESVGHESTRFIASSDTAPMAICLAFLKLNDTTL